MNPPTRTIHPLLQFTSVARMLCGLAALTIAPACVDPPSPPLVDMDVDASRDLEEMSDLPGDLAPSQDMPDLGAPPRAIDPMCEPPPDDETDQQREMREGRLRRARGFAQGTGAPGKEYLICGKQQLQLIAVEEARRAKNGEPGGRYKLGQDIDIVTTSSWTPIPCFRGDFDGDAWTIRGMTLGRQNIPKDCFGRHKGATGAFMTVVEEGARVHDVRFEDVHIGASTAPLLEYFYGVTPSDRKLPHAVGGLFGVVDSATIDHIDIHGLHAHVHGFFGGVAYNFIDSVMNSVTIEDATIHHTHGFIGGVVARLINRTSGALSMTNLRVGVDVIQQDERLTTDSTVRHRPIGLLSSMLHGALRLDEATLSGTVDQRGTQRGDAIIIGGLIGQAVDSVPKGATPEELDALSTLKTRITRVHIKGFSVPECDVRDPDNVRRQITCNTAGGLMGTAGDSEALERPYVTSIEFDDITLEDTHLKAWRAGLLVSNIFATKVSASNIHISRSSARSLDPDAPEEPPCLLSYLTPLDSTMPLESFFTPVNVCVEESTCSGAPHPPLDGCAPE